MVFTIYGQGGHLGHLTCTIYINLRSPFLRLALIGQAVSEEKIFEIVDDGRTTDGRTPEHGHLISTPFDR